MTRRPLLALPRCAVLVAGALIATLSAACGAPAVAGVSSDFSLNRTAGQVMRWNPCAPVHWKLDAGIDPGAAGQVQSAVATLASATGMKFVYDGGTSYTPQSYSKLPNTLVVSFGRRAGLSKGSDLLHGGWQIGEGGWHATGTGPTMTSLVYKITDGYVVIDTDAYNRSTPGVRTAALLHELGHAVGLNHAAYTSEVMFPTINGSSPTHYAAGDLSGLRAVGAPAGCIR